MIGVESSNPGGPQISVQNAAATMIASGDMPVVWPNKLRLDDLAHEPFENDEEQRRLDDHAPAGIDGGGERQRHHRRNDRPRVGHEPQHRADDSPQDGIGDTDHVRPIAIATPKAAFIPVNARKYRLRRLAASSSALVVWCRSWEPMRPMNRSRRSPRWSRMKIDENDDDRSGGERRQKGRENALQDLHGPWRGLVHLDLHQRRSRRNGSPFVVDGGRAPTELSFFRCYCSSPCKASAAFSTTRLPKAELRPPSSFLAMTI